jgi:multiple sugar transport system ATP-binding protein
MNIIAGRIVRDRVYHLQAPHLDLPLPEDVVAGVAAGQEVHLGVRAEHVQVGSDGVPAQIRLTEPLGDATLVFFDYGGASQLVAKVDASTEYKVGDRIHFLCNPSGMLLFDAQDGTRL